MKRWLALFFAIALPALGSGAWWLFARPAPGPSYRLAAVESGPIVSAVTASGTLGAVVTVEVGSQLSGQIAQLHADFNSIVTAGQLLARIDTRLLEARLLQADADLAAAQAGLSQQKAQEERARAEVETARATLAGNDAQVARAELVLSDARRDLARRRSLRERGVTAEADLERAETAARSAAAQLASVRAQRQAAQAAVASAGAALRVAESQVAVAEAQVRQREAAARQVQVDIDRSNIRSPIDGVVVERAVNVGQTVASSLQAPKLFTIAQDLRRMQVLANVDEADIGKVRQGQPVSFTVNAFPGEDFQGRVSQMRLAAQNNQNVVTYVVVVEADNAGLRLLPGMTANVRIVAGQRDQALKLPNAALRYRPQGTPPAPPGTGPQVWVPGAGGVPEAMPVRLGITDGGFTEVLDGGLSAGQQVITGIQPPGEGGQTRRAPRIGF